MRDYEITEQAFVDVWKEFGEPDEIINPNDCNVFLNRLQEITKGLYIVDHLSGTNYDYVERIEQVDDFSKIIWKDLSENTDEITAMVFGNVAYIYSIFRINKLKFVYIQNHLFILVVPNVATDKEVMKVLGINKLKKDYYRIEENYKELTSEFIFIKEDELHRCISHKMPFYSFLLQPKESNRHTGISTKILVSSTLIDIQNRLNRVSSKLIIASHSDDLCEIGNTLRRILEHMLKYYMCYKNTSFPKGSYGHNMLGELTNAISNTDAKMGQIIDSDIKTIANELSHDSGKVFNKEDIERFLDKVNQMKMHIYEVTKE